MVGEYVRKMLQKATEKELSAYKAWLGNTMLIPCNL
jgi:hypothetical protein